MGNNTFLWRIHNLENGVKRPMKFPTISPHKLQIERL